MLPQSIAFYSGFSAPGLRNEWLEDVLGEKSGLSMFTFDLINQPIKAKELYSNL
jgi:hypothetical protein